MEILPARLVLPREAVLAQIRDLLVDELSPQPLWCCLFSDASLHRRLVPWLFERRAKLLFDSSYVLLDTADGGGRAADIDVQDRQRTLREGEQIVGHVALREPGAHTSPSVWKMIELGMLWWPFKFGVTSLHHFLDFTRRWEEHERRVCKSKGRCWSLEALAIRRSRQSQGLGSSLVRSVMTKVAPGSTVMLATQLERNVAFYQRLGFSVTDDIVFALGDGSFRTWALEFHT